MENKTDKKHLPKEVNRQVQEFFAESEISEKGTKLATSLKELDDIRAEAKVSADEFKTQIKTKEAEVSKLKDAINQGYEMVVRTCLRTKNFEKGIAEFTIDGKIIDSEPLTPEDHTDELPLAEEHEENEENEEEEEEHED